MLGIIIPMTTESSIFKENKNLKLSEKSKAMINFYEGEINNNKFVLAESGIGKVSAALCTQLLIELFSPTEVINIGVGGALDDSKVGDLIVGNRVIQYDIDTTAIGDPLGFIPSLKSSYVYSNTNLLKDFITSTKSNFKIGTIASADSFLTSELIKKQIIENYNGICCEMEGGAIGQVCKQNNIPFLLLRLISDSSNEESSKTYEESLTFLPKKIDEILTTFLEEMRGNYNE